MIHLSGGTAVLGPVTALHCLAGRGRVPVRPLLPVAFTSGWFEPAPGAAGLKAPARLSGPRCQPQVFIRGPPAFKQERGIVLNSFNQKGNACLGEPDTA